MRKNIFIGSVAMCAVLALLVGPLCAQEKPIKLGVMFVSSGPMGGYGKHGFQAVQLAVDEINAIGRNSWPKTDGPDGGFKDAAPRGC